MDVRNKLREKDVCAKGMGQSENKAAVTNALTMP